MASSPCFIASLPCCLNYTPLCFLGDAGQKQYFILAYKIGNSSLTYGVLNKQRSTTRVLHAQPLSFSGGDLERPQTVEGTLDTVYDLELFDSGAAGKIYSYSYIPEHCKRACRHWSSFHCLLACTYCVPTADGLFTIASLPSTYGQTIPCHWLSRYLPTKYRGIWYDFA